MATINGNCQIKVPQVKQRLISLLALMSLNVPYRRSRTEVQVAEDRLISALSRVSPLSLTNSP